MSIANGEVYFDVNSLAQKPFIDTAIHEAIHIIYPKLTGSESFHGGDKSPDAVIRGQDAAGEFAFRSITTSEILRLTGRPSLEEQDALNAARNELNTNVTTRPDLSGVIWDSYTPDQIRAAITDKTSIYWGHLPNVARVKNYDLTPESSDPWTTQEVSEDGASTITEDDFYDTQIWDELEVIKGTDGQITGAQVTLDPAVAAFTGSVGQIFGSAIGRALAPNDPFERIAITTVAATIGMKFAQVLSASLSANASQINISSILATGPGDLGAAGAGAVASFLVAELGEQLHLTGFSAQLFNSAVGGFAGSLAQQVARGGVGVLAGAAWGNALSAAQINVGGTLGSILSNLIHPAETQAGAIGGQLLGAIGSLAAATAIGTAAGLFLNIIVPGIGSPIGTLLGTMIGDAFGSVPHPTSVDIVEPTSYFYSHHHWAEDDGGDAELSAKLSSAVTEIVNADLAALDGIGLAASRQPIMIGYHTGYPAEPYITGWFPNGGEAPRFASAADAVNSVAIEIMQNTQVIGGNLLLKRAHQYSNYQDTATLAGDMQIAVDYERYLNNREVINALMAANPDTAFTAGWAATFARAKDLHLDQSSSIDVFGGLVGWLDSVSKAGLGAEAANASVRYSGSSVVVEVKVANGAEVPGSLSVFADQVSQSSDATGTTVQFTFAGGLAASFNPRSGATTGSGGNDLWFGSVYAVSSFAGAGGHDILVGGASDDTIAAGAGFDFIDGGVGNDNILGEAGNDILVGGKGWDYLRGGAGDDAYVFNRGDGGEFVYDDYRYMTSASSGSSTGAPSSGGGGGTPQEVHPDGGNDSLVFGPGISASDLVVQVSSSTGADLVVGVRDPAHPNTPFAELTDTITLRHFIDDPYDRIETLRFADGTSISLVAVAAAGSGGDDLLYGVAGAQAIDGGTGVNTMTYIYSPAAVAVDLAYSYGRGGDAEWDRLVNIQNLTGSAYNDTLTGDRRANILSGGAGDDTLDGGAGADTLSGGAGNNTATYAASGAGVTVSLLAGTAAGGTAQGDTVIGIQNLTGSAFSDRLTGDGQANVLQGGAGNDALYGNDGAAVFIPKRRALRQSRGKSRHASRVPLPALLVLEPNARNTRTNRVECIRQHCT
jgi:Ca2+-binding RTX toxin-like protein